MHNAIDIFNISPVTYCHLPTYSPFLKIFKNASKKELIEQTIVRYSNMNFQQLSKKDRRRSVVEIRQIAIYLLTRHTTLLLKEIGDLFGGKDHSTVVHSRDMVIDLMKVDLDYRDKVMELDRQISGMKYYDSGRVA